MAGHQNGASVPAGRIMRLATASQPNAMATVPYNIGQPTSARVVSGNVNIRAGKVDSWLTMSASRA